MRAAMVGGLLALWPALAPAAELNDKPIYAPPGDWVKLLPIPAPGAAAAQAGAAEMLLENSQIRLSPDGDEYFNEYAIRVNTPEGLPGLGTVERVWNPETNQLTIHRLRIIRGDKVIDLLAGGKTFTVLRRETKLEMAMLDGSLTAAFQPEGLQVGDVLDFAFTFKDHDPVWRGVSDAESGVLNPGPIEHFYLSAMWDRRNPIHYMVGDGLGAAKVRQEGERTVLEIDRTDFTAPKVPQQAPPRFSHPTDIHFTGFADWSQASALMAPLYEKASTLTPDSPLKGEIARIAAASRDPRTRAAAALHLVQEQVRYFFLGMDLGGFVPADADVTWQRRFGDCKGKTALLLALLKGLGIEAEPALVSSTRGDGMDALPPRLRLFDHVIVRAVIGGKAYWLDGTRRGDRGLDDIQPPPFRWALPLRPTGAKLTAIDQPPFPSPQTEAQTTIDMTGGADAPANVHVEFVARGDQAIGLHITTQTLAAAVSERNLRALFTKAYPWVSVDKVAATWDEAAGVERLAMDGKGAAPWSRFPGGRQLHLIGSQLGGAVSFTRQPGPHQDAPFAVAFPAYTLSRTVVKLPGEGVGFALGGAGDIDQTVGGLALRRHTQMSRGVVTMEASMQSVAREFSAADAPAAAATLQQLGLRDVWIAGSELASSNPGLRPDLSGRGFAFAPVASGVPGLKPPPPLFIPPVASPLASPVVSQAPVPAPMKAKDMPKPVTALAHLERARAWQAEGEPARALDDLKAARALEPRNTQVLVALAQTQAAADDYAAARASLAMAMEIDPKDPLLWVGRGAVRLAAHDADGVRDIDHGVDIGPDGPKVMVFAGRALMRLGLWEPAIGYFDQAVAAFPTDPDLGATLGSRCLARAQWGRRLDRAVHDCQTALTLARGDGDALSGRAVVDLRLNLPDKALVDAESALATRPNDPLALYLRGVARSRKGAAGAKDDLAAARRMDPAVATRLTGFDAGT